MCGHHPLVNCHLSVLTVASEVMTVRRVVRAVSLLPLADAEGSKHVGSDVAQLGVILGGRDEQHCRVHVWQNDSIAHAARSQEMTPAPARGAIPLHRATCGECKRNKYSCAAHFMCHLTDDSRAETPRRREKSCPVHILSASWRLCASQRLFCSFCLQDRKERPGFDVTCPSRRIRRLFHQAMPARAGSSVGRAWHF